MDTQDRNFLLKECVETALEAGEAVLGVYASDFNVELKDDKSPVTEADTAANAIITGRLFKHSPHPVITEEGATIPYQVRKSWKRFWLVDPLDGTKEFVKRNGEFTVNIALMENGAPVLGAVYVPVKRACYFGGPGIGAYRLEASGVSFGSMDEMLKASVKLPCVSKGERVKIVASRSHMSKETAEYLEAARKLHGDVDTVNAGSSFKFCLIAEGSADIYPRFGPTMEWDTAAGQAVAEGAGAEVLDYSTKKPLVYNKEDLKNPWFIVKRKDVKAW
ncbi:MAG: 3'(2'),5'-bisphosphate nucleotidase CysQ [Deltaproteobacteria bacterium]|nr:3'(2'),5'-bisphosphate nucleotidase CysQ [Deltaproteobacteria bacterium]